MTSKLQNRSVPFNCVSRSLRTLFIIREAKVLNNKTQVELQTSSEILILAEAHEQEKQTAQKKKREKQQRREETRRLRINGAGRPEGGVRKRGAELGVKHQFFLGKLSERSERLVCLE